MKRGTYRSLHTALFDDLDYERLSPEARHTLLVLRMGSQSNIACIYRLRINLLTENTGYPIDTLSHTLTELQAPHEWIAYDGVVVWIKNGLKFDPSWKPDNPKLRRAVEKILSGLPKSLIIKRFCDYYQFDLPRDTLFNRYDGGMDSPIPNPIPIPIPSSSDSVIGISTDDDEFSKLKTELQSMGLAPDLVNQVIGHRQLLNLANLAQDIRRLIHYCQTHSTKNPVGLMLTILDQPMVEPTPKELARNQEQQNKKREEASRKIENETKQIRLLEKQVDEWYASQSAERRIEIDQRAESRRGDGTFRTPLVVCRREIAMEMIQTLDTEEE